MRLLIFLLILTSLAVLAASRALVAREARKTETISLIRNEPLIHL